MRMQRYVSFLGAVMSLRRLVPTLHSRRAENGHSVRRRHLSVVALLFQCRTKHSSAVRDGMDRSG